MEQVFIMLEDQVDELEDERAFTQTVEASIMLNSAIYHLDSARACLRRAIAAEAKVSERLFDAEVDISDYEVGDETHFGDEL